MTARHVKRSHPAVLLALVPLLAAVPALGADPLDPTTIPKYVTPLVIPPAMPRTSVIPGRGGSAIDYYEIAVRQFQQQILPEGFPPTTVWGYGSVNHPGTFHAPSFTIEVRHDRPARIKWINGLMDDQGRYLPHLLAVDQTLHWANPPGPVDSHSMDPAPYTGPVPMVTHLHGSHAGEESDGYAEAWYLPAAVDAGGFHPWGSFYEKFRSEFLARFGVAWEPGSATFQYPNDQRAATLWYHDHTLGMTRLNVYAGPAGFYIVRGGPGDRAGATRGGMTPARFGGVLPGPAPAEGDSEGTRYHEIVLAVQDRSFYDDGSLLYPDSRADFDGFEGPYIPDSDISPIWNPEVFSNAMMVNGRTWPVLDVEARRYRFRLLDGCNSRFLMLKIVAGDPEQRPAKAAAKFWQIGAEGGFLETPAPTDRLLMAPGERADTIVDFTGFAPGTELFMINEGPDEPFGDGEPGEDFDWANPATTGQVMMFRVVAPEGADLSAPPDLLRLPHVSFPRHADRVRRLALMEEDSDVLEGIGPRRAVLGIIDEEGEPRALGWDDPITEIIRLGDTEVWEIYNFTEDAHPIHLHQITYQVLGRAPIDDPEVEFLPEPTELGLKDTAIAYPEEILRLKARFDTPGTYVWHCHIVEHEDNEMMRPFEVRPK